LIRFEIEAEKNSLTAHCGVAFVEDDSGKLGHNPDISKQRVGPSSTTELQETHDSRTRHTPEGKLKSVRKQSARVFLNREASERRQQ